MTDIHMTTVSRRRALQLFGGGAAGVAFLAACGRSSKATGTKGSKEFHGAWPFSVPPKGHFNELPGMVDMIIGDGPYLDLLVPPPAMYLWKEKTYQGLMAESWTLDATAKTYTVKLRTGLKWSDGKPQLQIIESGDQQLTWNPARLRSATR